MPTVMTHAVVPLAIGLALGPRVVNPRLLAVGMLAAMLPDVDVIAFKLGIAYGNAFGHRGASHSLLFAACVGLFGALLHQTLRSSPWRATLWLCVCAASHAALDAFTNGGLGVALAWPWSDARYFAVWRPITVSPIGAGFFSPHGLAVLLSELRWVWLPTLACAGLIAMLRRVNVALSSPR